MSRDLNSLIAREIKTRDERRRATVVSGPVVQFDDTAQAREPQWVVSVDIGARRPIDGVPVKSNTGTGGISYARIGQPVTIQRSAGGRWICIGPADRVQSVGNTSTLDEVTDTFGTPVAGIGFSFRREPFSYYQGDGGLLPGTSRWGSRGFPKRTRINAAGEEV